ncbi:MAG: shikimate kinase [Flavobacteriaceae bacterium]|nr:shikimate kinase [Flavobacteriaceae bacterium]
MKIVLVGYMGSGKSSVGVLLAHQLKISFIDLDHYIEQKEQLTVAEIFKSKGEIYFRKKETHYLQEILEFDQDLVLALGGGTPCYGNNMDLLKKYSTTIYLKSAIHSLVHRLIVEKQQRPLIAHLNDEDLPEFIGKHLFERVQFYQQSEITVVTDGKEIATIAHEILTNLS